MSSVAARASDYVDQLRINEVLASQNYKRTSVLFGVGCELDAPTGHGSLASSTSDGVSSGNQRTTPAALD